MKKYVEPIVEVVIFEENDVIITRGDIDTPVLPIDDGNN